MTSRPRFRAVAGCLASLLAFSVSGHTQLDSSCMVSAFNRTAPVQPDGVWVLPNVPANLGQVRVRATCVKDGVVSFGASALMTVPANGVIKVEDIQFEGPPPIPSSLSLSAPVTALTFLGQTVQLAVVATYPGGSTADVRSTTIPIDNREAFVALCRRKGVNPVLENPGSSNEHYHLNF